MNALLLLTTGVKSTTMIRMKAQMRQRARALADTTGVEFSHHAEETILFLRRFSDLQFMQTARTFRQDVSETHLLCMRTAGPSLVRVPTK